MNPLFVIGIILLVIAIIGWRRISRKVDLTINGNKGLRDPEQYHGYD